MDLGEFLLARIAEDEAVARGAAERDPSPWTHGDSAEGPSGGVFNANAHERTVGGWPGTPERVIAEADPVFTFDGGFGGAASAWPETASHVARWDPARVLAECEAKRRIVTERPAIDAPGLAINTVHREVQRQREYVFQLLALPYASHPDFRPEWSALAHA